MILLYALPLQRTEGPHLAGHRMRNLVRWQRLEVRLLLSEDKITQALG